MAAIVTRVVVALPADASGYNALPWSRNPLAVLSRIVNGGGCKTADDVVNALVREGHGNLAAAVGFSRTVVAETVGRVLRIDGEYVRYMDDSDYIQVPVIWNGTEEERINWSGYVRTDCGAGERPSVQVYREGFELATCDGCQSPNSEYVHTGETHKTFTAVAWEVDATDGVRAVWEAWNDERQRLHTIKQRAANLAKSIGDGIKAEMTVRRDVDVVVVKGRKVKKGVVARVAWIGEGAYGPYANIVTPDGVKYHFISLGNLEVIPQWEYRFAPLAEYGLPADVLHLTREFAAGRLSWEILCDRIADLDTDNYAGYEFAAALRSCSPVV